MNQALFTRILVSDDGEVAGELGAPFDLPFRATGNADAGLVNRRQVQERPRGPLTGPRGLSKQLW